MLSEKIEIRTSPAKWFDGWKKINIDMTSHEDITFTHYDLSVIEMFNKYGADLFALQDIWRVDWSNLVNQARFEGWLPENFILLKHRQRFLARFFHFYMRITIDFKFIRYIEKIIFKKDFSYES